MKIENYPVVKVLFPYLCGIVVAYLGDFSDVVCRVFLWLAASFLLLTTALTFVRVYRWRVVQTFSMSIVFMMMGITLTDWHFHSPEGLSLMDTSKDWLVRIAADPSPRERSVKVEAEVMRAVESEAVKGRVLLYLQPSERVLSLAYGDLLLVHAPLSRIAPPCNPEAFDNQRYMRRRGIRFSGYVRDGAWERVGHKPANRLKQLAQKVRKYLTGMYVSAGMSGEELDVLKAILLGDDDTLDPDLRASYSSAGVSHILCVSGMHVGIIFMIINFLLKPFDLFKASRIFKTFLVLVVIWLYAHITGLAPSVTRSAAMFTFVAVGQVLRRNTNVFHSLFASMFILLIVNPLLLFEVGFQLSYLAVTGIVLFQPKIAGLYQCRTRIGKYFWELLTVSVAAQLGTAPVSIYYFAQFPNYFMLSNLSVIALSFVVIITGVALLPFSLVPPVSRALTWVLTMEIRLMNRIIVWVEHLPHAVTENIDYHIVQVLLLYGVIGCFCYLLYNGNRKVFWATGVLFTLFCLSFPLKKLILLRETDFMAYHIRKVAFLEFSAHGQAVWFSDSIHSLSDRQFQYNVRDHARKNHLKGVFVPLDTAAYEAPFLCKQGNFIRFGKKNYYVLTKDERIYRGTGVQDVYVDCLILHQNPRMSPGETRAAIPFSEVVADGTNTPFYIEKWRSFCVSEGIPFTYTEERIFN